jgi:hypothetical protein
MGFPLSARDLELADDSFCARGNYRCNATDSDNSLKRNFRPCSGRVKSKRKQSEPCSKGGLSLLLNNSCVSDNSISYRTPESLDQINGIPRRAEEGLFNTTPFVYKLLSPLIFLVMLDHSFYSIF